MTGVLKMYLRVETLNEAVEMATDRWKQIMSDEEATLPWSTHYNITEDGDKLEVEVIVEFDRRAVEDATTS